MSELIEALEGLVPFEYMGKTGISFRGFSTRERGRDSRRRFWVMRERGWTRGGGDPYRKRGATPLEDIQSALANGVSGIVCNSKYINEPMLQGKNVFFTPNTFEFTVRAIEALRKLTPGRRTIAVTGSAGKSSTCAMIAHALGSAPEVRNVQFTRGNANLSHLILAQQSRTHRYSRTVLEVAGSAFFPFSRGAYSVSADVGIVTSIAEAHLDYLGDLAGVAQYKSEIFNAPPRDGLAVINADAPYSEILVKRARREGARIVTYGESHTADIVLKDFDASRNIVNVSVGEQEIQYRLGASGKHMALNSLAVLAALRDLGHDWQHAMHSLDTFVPPEGRGQEVMAQVPAGGQFTVLDDSYNANPASVAAALDSLAERSVEGRKIAVLGDILELGEHADKVHAGLKTAIVDAQLDEVHLLGEHMKALKSHITESPTQVYYWRDLDALIKDFSSSLKDGDVILVKGSGGMGLKQLVDALRDGVPNERSSEF